MQEALSRCGFRGKRFAAIYGAALSNEDFRKYREFIPTITRLFCPRSALGCALSHRLLCKQYLEEDPAEVCLILEDDCQPVMEPPRTLLAQVLAEAPPDWEVIKLDYWPHVAMTEYKSLKAFPSFNAGAYLLRKSGARKFMSKRIYYHLDVEWLFRRDIKIYHSPLQIFRQAAYPSHNVSAFRLNPLRLKRLDYKALRIPLLGIELNSNDLLLLSLVSALIGVALWVRAGR